MNTQLATGKNDSQEQLPDYALPLRRDPRLRDIRWKDLRSLTSGQKLYELFLSAPWLLLTLLLFHSGWILPGLIPAFFFFLAGLRQCHGAQHYSLGWGRRVQDILLSVLSVLMATSMHALQATHLYHHRYTLEESDVESFTAKLPWWQALLAGPWFILKMNLKGYSLAKPEKKKWIWAEWGITGLWITSVFLWGTEGLKIFVAVMILGECCTGFFAVWTVHHDCDPHKELARTQRGWWKNLISYEMFYHTEHHLFPGVPTPRLPELAERIDRVIPEIREKQVF